MATTHVHWVNSLERSVESGSPSNQQPATSNQLLAKEIRPASIPATCKSPLSRWLALTKFRISAVSTLTAATGHIAFSRSINGALLGAVSGTLMMAMASSAFNEVQERKIDATMNRTRSRPIPGGLVTVQSASIVAVFLGVFGCAILYATRGATPALLGLLAMVWYNGLYTPLKRVTAFAVVPGSVIGALPPAIGWATAGGSLDSPAILSLCFVFFVWQVPHFWLLALRHQDDYARAGLPTLSRHFSTRQIFRLIFTWTASSVAASALLAVFQTITGIIAAVAIGAAGVWLLVRFSFLLREHEMSPKLFRAFLDINRYALVIMAAVVFDALVGT
jgi:protoheme IX farnesyltransferase